MAAAQQNSIWEKCHLPNIFRSGGICRRKERSRRWPSHPHNRWARPGRGRAPMCVEASCLPSVSSSSSVGLLGK
jgi:hypothetical protein